jgi:uncharacterized membrane protein YbhN (UPF0104 family)
MDATAVLERFENADLLWILPSSVAIAVATVLGAINAHLFVNRNGWFRFFDFLPLYWQAWAWGLVVPGQIGDIASLSIMLRRHGLPWHASLGRTLLDKAISFVLVTIYGFLGLVLAVSPRDFQQSGLQWWILLVAGSVPILFVVRRRLGQILAPFLRRALELAKQTFSEAREVLQLHPARVGLNIALTAIKISIIGAAYWCMFLAMGSADISLIPVIMIAAASSLIAYIPISINGLGTVELAGIALFGAIGIAGPTVLSAYLALRLVVMTLAWVPTALFLIFGARRGSGPLKQSKG